MRMVNVGVGSAGMVRKCAIQVKQVLWLIKRNLHQLIKQMTSNKSDTLTLFYDGQCPLCKAEILFLESRNTNGLLEFVDVSDQTYSEQTHKISCDAALAQMHGKLASGQILTGVSVFAAAYERVDLNVLAWIFSRNWLLPFLQFGYKIFAKYRHQISRTIGPFLLKIAEKRFSK